MLTELTLCLMITASHQSPLLYTPCHAYGQHCVASGLRTCQLKAAKSLLTIEDCSLVSQLHPQPHQKHATRASSGHASPEAFLSKVWKGRSANCTPAL